MILVSSERVGRATGGSQVRILSIKTGASFRCTERLPWAASAIAPIVLVPMGSFFTNVHVRAPAGEEESTRITILEVVSRLAADNGLVPSAEGEQPDRSIVVGRGGAWIGVFDEATESQDVRLLDALAKALSEATGCPALAALVHDSDHLLLYLFEGGKLVDEVDREKKKGRLELWSGLVAPDKAEALRASFVARDLFAEQTLAE